jgi:hypothetical protein
LFQALNKLLKEQINENTFLYFFLCTLNFDFKKSGVRSKIFKDSVKSILLKFLVKRRRRTNHQSNNFTQEKIDNAKIITTIINEEPIRINFKIFSKIIKKTETYRHFLHCLSQIRSIVESTSKQAMLIRN